MDSFIGLAKQGFEAYESSQSGGGASATGGSQYNAPHGQSQGEYNNGGVDNEAAAQRAAEQSGQDPSLFHQALQHVHSNQAQHQAPVDEEAVVNAHKAAYGGGDASSLDEGSMGAAAAMQIMKQFTSGGGGGGGGGMQTQLMSMAMSEASNLFDSSGSSGNKQACVNSAAMMVMKLMVQSKLGMLGGGNSGGLGGIMGMVGKFM